MGRGGIAAVAIVVASCGRINFETPPPIVCGPDYAPADGTSSRYRVASGPTSWFAAQADCESDGGHLVVIESAAENVLVSTLASNMELWLGLSDHVQEGTYTWVTGKPMTFESFAANEPNNSNGSEDCIHMLADTKWNDKGCRGGNLLYVCECDLDPLPDPPTFCDTDVGSNCGECDSGCTLNCTGQVCGGGGGG